MAEERDLKPLLGRPISLINTPNHQRWWLPDRDYWYEIKINRARRVAIHRIVHNETQRIVSFPLEGKRVVEQFTILLDHPRYHELTLYAQELANKRFRRPDRRDWQGKKVKEKVFYNVVNVKEPQKALMENVAFLNLAQAFKATQTIRYPGETFEIVEITKE